jgi:hypothetical protein
LKNDLLNQLNAQKQLFDVKVKELQDSEKFYQGENEFMKMKQENMIKGITCLKKYMYQSMSEAEKAENKQKLETLDKAIGNLNNCIQKNREEHKTRIETFTSQSVEKLG